MMPATMPMIVAPRASTVAQVGVMATRPASEAFKVIETSGFPFLNQVKNIVVMAATAGAIVVVVKTAASPPTPPNWVQAAPLNPYQPNHKMNVPNAPRVREWPGMAWAFVTLPFLS